MGQVWKSTYSYICRSFTCREILEICISIDRRHCRYTQRNINATLLLWFGKFYGICEEIYQNLKQPWWVNHNPINAHVFNRTLDMGCHFNSAWVKFCHEHFQRLRGWVLVKTVLIITNSKENLTLLKNFDRANRYWSYQDKVGVKFRDSQDVVYYGLLMLGAQLNRLSGVNATLKSHRKATIIIWMSSIEYFCQWSWDGVCTLNYNHNQFDPVSRSQAQLPIALSGFLISLYCIRLQFWISSPIVDLLWGNIDKVILLTTKIPRSAYISPKQQVFGVNKMVFIYLLFGICCGRRQVLMIE